MNTAEYLLRRMIEVAEEQVSAAKKIDIPAAVLVIAMKKTGELASWMIGNR